MTNPANFERRAIDPDTDSGLSLGVYRRVAFVPSSGKLTILINPKSACSTLKFRVWQQEFASGASEWEPPGAHGGIHRKERTPFRKPVASELEQVLLDRPLFSIVRNPYTRVLSAYLDKIAGDKKEKARLLLMMGRYENVPVTFAEFVDFVCSHSSMEMDPHYAPQAFLMQIRYLPYTKIGSVEQIDTSISDILAQGYGIMPAANESFRPHRTGASSRTAEYYTPELAAKILKRYRADFEIFGYGKELADSHLPPTNLDQAAQLGRGFALTNLRSILRAGAAEESKDYAAALEAVAAVKHADPELDFLKGRMLLRRRRYDEALPLLQSAARAANDVGHYWFLLADCLLALRRKQDAVEAVETSVVIWPSEIALQQAAKVQGQAGNKEKSRHYLERAAAARALTLAFWPKKKQPPAPAQPWQRFLSAVGLAPAGASGKH